MKYLYSATVPIRSSHFTAHPTSEEDSRIISSTVVVSPIIPNNKVLCDDKQTYHKLMGVVTLSYSSGGYTGVGITALKMDGDTSKVFDSVGLTENVVEAGQSGQTSVTISTNTGDRTTVITLSLDENLNPSLSATNGAEIVSPNYSKIVGASGEYVSIVGSGTAQYVRSGIFSKDYYRKPFSIQIDGRVPVSVASQDRAFITKETTSDSTSIVIPITNGVSVSTVVIDNVYFECTDANQDKIEVD